LNSPCGKGIPPQVQRVIGAQRFGGALFFVLVCGPVMGLGRLK
jgi:hypothetical protein